MRFEFKRIVELVDLEYFKGPEVDETEVGVRTRQLGVPLGPSVIGVPKLHTETESHKRKYHED